MLGFTPVRGLQLRLAVCGLLAVIVAVAVYAYLGKVLPDVVADAHVYARLASPVGYWNVLALMMVMGIVIVLAVAGDRAVHPIWRAAAAAGGVVLAFTFFFALSRGGWVVLLIALLLYFAFTSTRLASFATLVAVAVPVVVVLLKVRHLGTLFSATNDDALRTLQGHALLRYSLAALLVAGGVQAAIALVQRAMPWSRRLRVAAGVALICVIVLGVGGGTWRFVEARGGLAYLHSRVTALASDSGQGGSTNNVVRLESLNTGRPPLWREALDQSAHNRLLGTGAGTFVFTHYRFRLTGGVVRHAHSEWFNVLSELGVVGLVLFVAAMALLVAAAVGNPFADRGDPMHPALVALQAGIAAFVVHISWDWDWDMAAAGVMFFFLVAVCSSYLTTRKADQRRLALAHEETTSKTPPRRHSSQWPLRAVAATALVILALSWLLPYLSARAENAAVNSAGNGDATLALAQTRHAANLDPLAVDPLITESLVLQQLGENRAALQVLNNAARLQPNNYEVYYGEGVLLLTAYGRKQAAIAAFKHALALNPLDYDTQNELAVAVGS